MGKIAFRGQESIQVELLASTNYLKICPTCAAVQGGQEIKHGKSVAELEVTVAEIVGLPDVTAVVKGDIGAVSSHKSIIETKQDPVVAVHFGRLVDFDLEGAIMANTHGVALDPILISWPPLAIY